MKFTISRDGFLNGLQRITGVVEKRQTLPILANVLIATDQGQLSITGTDLEVEVISKITSSHILEEGATTIPARKLFDIVRSLDDDSEIELATDEEKSRVIVRSGRSRFTLSTLPETDFPNVEESMQACEFQLPQNGLKRLIEKVSFAMAQQDVRYYLNGMLFEITEAHLRVVSTDGHRLAMSTLPLPGLHTEKIHAILPRKGVLELSRLLIDSDDPVTVNLGVNHICLSTDSYKFTSKLVDGKFPDYEHERVLPRNANKKMQAPAEAIKQSFIRAAILSNEKYRGVSMQLENNVMRLTAKNPERERAEEELTVDYSEEPIEIGFNVGYMIEALSIIKQGDVCIYLADTNSSALMQAKDDANTVYVIMPMRL